MDTFPWQCEILRPWWLAALLILPLLAYYARRSLVPFASWQRVASLVCRMSLLAALVLAMCGIRVTTDCRRLFVVFATDDSRSISEPARAAADTFRAEALKQAAGNESAALWFAAAPFASQTDARADANRLGTDISAAILAAKRLTPTNRVPRIVLLSDGNQTTGDALAAAKAAGMPIWTVPLPGGPKPEVYVAAVEAPAQVRPGDSFDVDVVVESTDAGSGRVELRDGSRRIAEEKMEKKDVAPGENRIRFRHVAADEREITLTAQLYDFPDTVAENNRASAKVSVAARRRVLLVESGPLPAARLAEPLVEPPVEPLPAALKQAYFDVGLRSPENMPPRLADLQAYDLLILSNVPAAALPAAEMEVLQQYVGQFGGGLIVVGGDRSLTAGDYGHSRLEEVLPVSCEARRELEKPGLAMVLVIDCSSSMAAANSIELAREAARRAVQRLGPRDQVGILAFTEGTRWVSQIVPCSDQAKQEVLRQIETIQADGRTDMYPAVEKAWLALRDAFADRKHMIVLTDGISHPGDFEQLAGDVAADGITVSTVGLGREAVPLLLTRIAEIGGGTYYPCDDPAAVPSIFAQETLSAARVGIVEKPFSPKAIGAAEVFGDLDLGRIPTLLGYVETYPKPAARVLLETELGDPLLACWQYGRGVSVVFTSDIQADWAATWLQWPDFGPFWGCLARFAMRKDGPRDGQRLAPMARYPDELRFRPTDAKLLQAIASAGGGRYDPKPADVFARPQRGVRQTTELWTYLLAAAALLLLLDVTLKRVSFSRDYHDAR